MNGIKELALGVQKIQEDQMNGVQTGKTSLKSKEIIENYLLWNKSYSGHIVYEPSLNYEGFCDGVFIGLKNHKLSLVGIEVKTDRDSLTRLKRQIEETYTDCFHKIIFIFHKCHVKKAIEIISSHSDKNRIETCDIIEYYESENGIVFNNIKVSEFFNSEFSSGLALYSFLHSHEIKMLLKNRKYHGEYKPNSRHHKKYYTYSKLANSENLARYLYDNEIISIVSSFFLKRIEEDKDKRSNGGVYII